MLRLRDVLRESDSRRRCAQRGAASCSFTCRLIVLPVWWRRPAIPAQISSVRLSRLSLAYHWPWLLATLIGCIASTEPGRPGAPIVGAWRYAGRQLSPIDGELAGTLSVASQTGATIAGSLDVVETDGRGGQRRSAGPFAGRTTDSTTVDFDVRLSGNTRRHVGRVARDTLIGTWIEQSVLGGAPTASGSFVAVRVR